MKIAISVQETQRDTNLDARFGRALHFAVYDTETRSLNFIDNQGQQSAHGAGTQTAQMLLNLGIQKAISGAFGPNAAQVLESAGISMETIPDAANQTLTDVIATME